MRKQDLVLNVCFRERITKNVYVFDILARKNKEIYPKMIGVITVNVNSEERLIQTNTGVTLSVGDDENITKVALASAKKLKALMKD